MEMESLALQRAKNDLQVTKTHTYGPSNTHPVVHERKEAAVSLQMGNAEDTDELIGKTGSGNKHLTVQLRIWHQCGEMLERVERYLGPFSQERKHVTSFRAALHAYTVLTAESMTNVSSESCQVNLLLRKKTNHSDMSILDSTCHLQICVLQSGIVFYISTWSRLEMKKWDSLEFPF